MGGGGAAFLCSETEDEAFVLIAAVSTGFGADPSFTAPVVLAGES